MNPPAGTTIERSEHFDGVVYSWRPVRRSSYEWGLIAFFVIWFCAWFGGMVVFFVTRNKMQPNVPPDVLSIIIVSAVITFVIFVIAAWSLFKPRRPESVTLRPGAFRHEPGSFPREKLFNPWTNQNPLGPFVLLFTRRRPIEVSKSDLRAIVLDRVGERQRLYFDHGADRIEIGEQLREPEREWLAAVIKEWQAL